VFTLLKGKIVVDEQDSIILDSDIAPIQDEVERPWPEPDKKMHPGSEVEDRIATIAGNALERVDSLVYSIVGFCFLIGAFCALGYSFWTFGTGLRDAIVGSDIPKVATTVIQLVSDLLLVLIIMEVLGTVIHYLKAHATSLRPFLFIGIVSATRGILSIGAKLSIEQKTSGPDFTSSMIELGVNAAVILTLGITLKLLGKLIEDHAS
jgi:uncharacterized membrane protein (DUF373 family)